MDPFEDTMTIFFALMILLVLTILASVALSTSGGL